MFVRMRSPNPRQQLLQAPESYHRENLSSSPRSLAIIFMPFLLATPSLLLPGVAPVEAVLCRHSFLFCTKLCLKVILVPESSGTEDTMVEGQGKAEVLLWCPEGGSWHMWHSTWDEGNGRLWGWVTAGKEGRREHSCRGYLKHQLSISPENRAHTGLQNSRQEVVAGRRGLILIMQGQRTTNPTRPFSVNHNIQNIRIWRYAIGWI